MKPLKLLLISLLLFSACNQKKENQIVVTRTLVFKTEVGPVGSGSCLFDYERAEKGYLIQLKSGGKIVRDFFCFPDQLNFNIEKMKYEFQQKDSIIKLPDHLIQPDRVYLYEDD